MLSSLGLPRLLKRPRRLQRQVNLYCPRQPLRLMAGESKDERPRKKVILCLHGYLQNSEVFRSKFGSWRKALRQRADFHFVDAPFLVAGDDKDVELSGGAREGPRRAWWNWQDIEPGMRPSLAASYSGWEASLEMLVKKVKELKPDGLVGFSQGATATALLLAALSKQETPLRCAILIAGFLPRDQQWARVLESSQSNLPILLIHGDSDALIPMKRSEELEAALRIGNTQIERISHPGAHMVPSCSHDLKLRIQTFLDELH